MSKPNRSVVSQELGRFDQTLRALADVDNCRVIDHQAVQVWADSLRTETPLPTPYFSTRDE